MKRIHYILLGVAALAVLLFSYFFKNNGKMVKETGVDTVWYIKNGFKYHVDTTAQIEQLGGGASIVSVPLGGTSRYFNGGSITKIL